MSITVYRRRKELRNQAVKNIFILKKLGYTKKENNAVNLRILKGENK